MTETPRNCQRRRPFNYPFTKEAASLQNSMKAISEPRILELGEDFYSPVQPAKFPQGILRFKNEPWARNLGLIIDNDGKTSKKNSEENLDTNPDSNLANRFNQKETFDWAKYLLRFEAFPGNIPTPLALKYHGHQFRHYNPDLGDGRGFLFAQFKAFDPATKTEKLFDLGTKGSGQTPYSRSGDGRLTLKGAVREALATELLESLGVNTSKTFCIFETGEKLERNDEPSPTRSAVLTRLSHGHIRFGTFQRLAYFNETENIKKLLHYCVENYYPELLEKAEAQSPEQAALFFKRVLTSSAHLTAQWMIAGFVHGVLNTDNMNITGESFDYGPYRFLPNYDPAFTAAYFDQTGLYSYGRQPNSVSWNLLQLGHSLEKAFENFPTKEILGNFGDQFTDSVFEYFFKRLNLKAPSKLDAENVINSFFQFLISTDVGFEQSFFDFFGGADNDRWQKSPQAKKYQGDLFNDFLSPLKRMEVANPALNNHEYFKNPRPSTLLIDEIENIWKDIDQNDNWSTFDKKIDQLKSFRGIYKLF